MEAVITAGIIKRLRYSIVHRTIALMNCWVMGSERSGLVMWDRLLGFFLDGENMAFIIFSICMISGAVLMISYTKFVHMVIAISFTFFSLAGLYVMLSAEFVAFVQVLIYTGAITILMIFGMMMTGSDDDTSEPKRPVYDIVLLVGVLGFFLVVFYAIQLAVFPGAEEGAWEQTTESIGVQIFTEHVIAFELLSLLLTVALIGAILIAKREED